MCPHLVDPGANADISYVRLLTGRGLDVDLICTACDEGRQRDVPVALVVACLGCVARYAEDEVGQMAGWRGEPGIVERPEPFDPAVIATPLPVGAVPVADLAAVPSADGRSRWLLLTGSGRLLLFDADSGACEEVATCTVPAEPDREPWAGKVLRRRLHVSPDARFAAVVNDFGRYGQVIDLTTGKVTLALDGGTYRPDTVPFSLAFARHTAPPNPTAHHSPPPDLIGHDGTPGGRTVVVHRTDWNRLDVSDPATGRLLTARAQSDDHSLDYFHGALHPSPDGRWLADDGWVWAPVGVPKVWDLRRWLDAYPWESEDGPTLRSLCYRDYHWTVPMAWVGDDLLAVSGIGTDDEAMLPGVRIFDVTSGREVRTLAGPRGALFGAGQRLYGAAPEGLEIWDPATGHRTGRIPGFTPTHHHPTAGELVTLHEGRTSLLRWRLHPVERLGVREAPA